MKLTRILVILFWVALAQPSESPAAQICQSASIPASTPTDRFVDNGEGTVTDTVTGLVWKRCAEGQSWDGVTCAGSASVMTWQGALQAAANSTFVGHNDWRLPNIKELYSIVEPQCVYPAINLSVFPGLAASMGFWSGSPNVANPGGSWAVGFDIGIVLDGKGASASVRLVRGGQ